MSAVRIGLALALAAAGTGCASQPGMGQLGFTRSFQDVNQELGFEPSGAWSFEYLRRLTPKPGGPAVEASLLFQDNHAEFPVDDFVVWNGMIGGRLTWTLGDTGIAPYFRGGCSYREGLSDDYQLLGGENGLGVYCGGGIDFWENSRSAVGLSVLVTRGLDEDPYTEVFLGIGVSVEL